MERIEIQRKSDGPGIIIDPEKMTLFVEGPSYPEDALELYLPLISWVNSISALDPPSVDCAFHFTVLSSASHKVIYEILVKLERLMLKGSKINVVWKYDKDDLDMMEVGQDLKDSLELPIEIIQY